MTFQSLFAKLSRIKSDKMLQNSLWLAIYTASAAAGGFVYWTIAAHLYSTVQVGAAGTVTSLVALMSFISTLGLAEMVLRTYANNPSRGSLVVKSLTVVAANAAVLGGAWMFLGGGVVGINQVGGGWHLFAILFSMVGAGAITAVGDAVVVAARRPKLLLIEAGVSNVVRWVATIFLAKSGVDGLLTAYAIGSIVACSVSLVLARKVVREEEPVKETGGLRRVMHWRYATTNWVSGAVSLVPKAIAPSVVAVLIGLEEAAYVAVPLMLHSFLCIAPSVAAKTFIAESSRNPDKTMELAKRAGVGALLFTTIGAVVLSVFGGFLLLILGESYQNNATTTLRLLALAAVVGVPNYIMDALLNMLPKRKGYLYANLVGACGVVSIMLLMVQEYGIGWAWVCGQVFYLINAVFAWKMAHRPGEKPTAGIFERIGLTMW
jgi:O-antigen/teichoic acid export membrane protein